MDDIVDDEVAKCILRFCMILLIIAIFSLQFFILPYKCNTKILICIATIFGASILFIIIFILSPSYRSSTNGTTVLLYSVSSSFAASIVSNRIIETISSVLKF